MDIYTRQSRFKFILIILGAVLLAVTLWYSSFLAQQLKEKEEKDAVRYALSIDRLTTNQDLNADTELEASIVTNADIQLVGQYDDGELMGINWGDDLNADQDFLAQKIDEYIDSGREPIHAYGYAGLYPFNSKLLSYIKYFPAIQGSLVGLFVLLSYFLFNSSRNAEQNRVWAGMAKETAHQLGTPISAILAWIEHLKLLSDGNADQEEVLSELIKDVDRLELVADRFSKIGSKPVLVEIDLVKELDELKNYMKRRSSKHIQFDFPDPLEQSIVAPVNKHLFDWVIENLIRNALDAMDGKGTISTMINHDETDVTIDLTDTGKGIPAGKHKTVFRPGYSTKSRGWGLGLSLAKRIIESYHRGRIFVKNSKINEGTTFTIKIPKY
jgi:hypothetical protein